MGGGGLGQRVGAVDLDAQAPGRDIVSTAPGGSYDFATGSSFAAAHVTGAIALLRSRNVRTQAPKSRSTRSTADCASASVKSA